LSTHLRQFRRFAQYNAWFNDRLYELAGSLPEEQRRRDLGAFFRSIHGTLNHLLLTDRHWLSRFSQHPSKPAALQRTPLEFELGAHDRLLFEDFAELAAGRRETDAAIRAWVAELTPEILASDLHYARSTGQRMVAPYWHAIAHFFNHQTHHRGQVTTLLFQLGHDPGITDFLVTAFMPEDAGTSP
jgi:uncharacterized damage-inducible protein DinB